VCLDAATGEPFFWLGSTQWAIFRGYTIDEAKATISGVSPSAQLRGLVSMSA
jgi:hypothetical protein